MNTKKKFYINRNSQVTGEFEVHREDCTYMFFIEDALCLGEFSSCEEAMSVARRLYPNVDGCAFCCRRCHTR